METLPTPEEAGNAPGRLSPWQETHARLILGRVPQLQDLRFVLCPRKLDEYQFWMIYFTLCRRYLPRGVFDADHAAAAMAAAAAAGGGGGSPARGGLAAAGGAAAAAAGSVGSGGAAAAYGSGGALEELAADPELDAYLQEALDGGDGADEDGSDDGDLDDYINALDAEVNGSDEDEE
jgi:hypothetical protein